nr:potassium channel KAT3-like [Tanacetum cinerariifolium]
MMFPLDVASTMPFQSIYRLFTGELHRGQIFGFLNLLRLWRLRRVSELFSRLEKDTRFSYFWTRCIKLICRDSINEILRYASKNRLPEGLKEQMLAHMQLKFKTTELQQEEVLEDLPKAIRSSIAQHLFRKTVEKTHLFKGISEDLSRQLVTDLKAEYFPPKVEVILQNEIPTDFYIIVSGAMYLKDLNKDVQDEIPFLKDLLYDLNIEQMTSLDESTNHEASNYDQDDNKGSPINGTSRSFPLRVTIHGHRPREENKGAGNVIELPGSVTELLESFPLRVTIHGHRPREENKGAGNVIELPGSVTELLELAEKKLGTKGSFIQMENGSLVEDEYPAKIHVRRKLHYFPLIKDRLNEARRSLFRTTCFGPWLNITYVENDDVIGFKFGMVSFREYRNGDIPFRNRLFPEKIGNDVKIIDVLTLIEDEEKFSKVSDEDAIRLCLLLSLEVIFMGRELVSVVDDVLLRMVDNLDTSNTFPRGEHIWRKLYDSIRKVPIEIAPTKAEFQSNCTSAKQKDSREFHPGLRGRQKGREAALIDHVRDLEGLCESLLTLPKEVKSLRGRIFKLKSIIHVITLKTNRVEKEESLNKFGPQIEDLLKSTSEDEPDIKDNTSKIVEKDEEFSSDLAVLNGFCNLSQNEDEKGDCEHYKYTYSSKQENQIIRLADQRQQSDISKMAGEAEQKIESEIQRLYDHREDRLNKIAVEEKQRKFIGHMNSSAHMKLAIKRCVPKKRKYVDDVKRPFNRIDIIFLSHDLEEWLSREKTIATHDKEFRPWYLKMMQCLEEKIHMVLKGTYVFKKKNIDLAKYKIFFRHVDHVLKQDGVFGDCCVFLCMFLYRLAYGVPLVVDDPVQAALADHEKTIRIYFMHKMLANNLVTFESCYCRLAHTLVTSLVCCLILLSELRFEVVISGCFFIYPLDYVGEHIIELRLSKSKRLSYKEMNDLLLDKTKDDIPQVFLVDYYLKNLCYVDSNEEEQEQIQSPSYLRSLHVWKNTSASTSKGKVLLDEFEDVANGKGKVLLDDFEDVANGKGKVVLDESKNGLV